MSESNTDPSEDAARADAGTDQEPDVDPVDELSMNDEVNGRKDAGEAGVDHGDQDRADDRSDHAAPDVGEDGERGGVGRLEREGDIAADYLEELLDIADFDGDIDLDVENDRAMVSIVGTGLSNLVGQRGATLDALQDLTRLAVLRATGERSRLMLDIAGTRARRRDELHQVGTEAADRARSDGEPVRLDPMTPFERKVVHDAVAAAGLRSESDGIEPNRRVVVYPS